MNDKTNSPADLLLVEDANREAWRKSIFWPIDHPNPDELDNSRPQKPTSTSLLEGSREALASSVRMLKAARRNVEMTGQLSERACETCKPDLRPYMAPAMTGVIRADLRRALSEVKHWAEYVSHYERQADVIPIQRNDFLKAVEERIPF